MSWLSLGDGLAASIYYVEETSVGIDDAGGVVAAFIEDEVFSSGVPGMDIFVRSWNGSGWEVVDDQVADIPVTGRVAERLQLDVDGEGGTLMAWLETDPSGTPRQIYVYRLNR